MSNNPIYKVNEEALGRSPYDPGPAEEDDLWFVPAPSETDEQDVATEEAAPTGLPWPMAPRMPGLAPADWARAEARSWATLLPAAEALARLGERLRHMPGGALERLALLSVSALLQAEGTWLPPERIALYRALRIRPGDEARALARADWAVRRLMAGQGAAALDELRGFLGRHTVAEPLAPVEGVPGEAPLAGAEFDTRAASWTTGQKALAERHPLTRAAAALASWRAEELTPFDDLLEPAVAAMLTGGGHAPFLPLSAGQRLAPGIAAAPATRLASFHAAAEEGALAALRLLDRLAAWAARAAAVTGDLSGRTPPALIASLLRQPALSADLAAAEAGVSRIAARRNLMRFEERGLVREISGQARYRFWTARI